MMTPELAARLTLFAMRGCVPRYRPLRDDAWKFARGEGPVDTSEAIRRLAGLPKPFACWPEMDDDVLVIQGRIPARMRRFFERSPGKEAMFDEVHREELGDDYQGLQVLCVGRDDWQVLTFEELDAWHADYDVFSFNGSWGGTRIEHEEEVQARRDPESRLPAGALEDGRARGAVYVRDFGSGRFARRERHIAIARIEPGTKPALSCEHCNERAARYSVEWLDDEHPPRRSCQRCLDDQLSVTGFDEGRDMERCRVDLSVAELSDTRAELVDAAEELAFVWAMREPPPFIADFIARYRPPDEP